MEKEVFYCVDSLIEYEISSNADAKKNNNDFLI